MSNDTSETASIKQLEKSAKVIIILLMLIFSMRVWVDAYNHDDKIDNFKGFHILGEESGIWMYKKRLL